MWAVTAPSSDPGAKSLYELRPFLRPSRLRFSPLAGPATTRNLQPLVDRAQPRASLQKRPLGSREMCWRTGDPRADTLHLFRCLLRKHIFRENLFWPARSPTMTAPFHLPTPTLLSRCVTSYILCVACLLSTPLPCRGPGILSSFLVVMPQHQDLCWHTGRGSVNSVLAESFCS